MRRGGWIVLIVLLIAVGAGAAAFLRRGGQGDVQRTLIEAVEVGSFVREVTGTGVVEATLDRSLAFPGSGTVAEVPVREGDAVEAGQLLARLDTASIERDLASSRASLQSARADRDRAEAQRRIDRLDIDGAIASAEDAVANARDQLADARQQLTTTERLFEAGAASQNELTAARDAAAAAERRVQQAEIGLQTAQTRLVTFDQLAAAQRASSDAQIAQLVTTIGNLEARLAEARLTAPFAGVVTRIDIEPGDTVVQGSVLELVDPGQLTVDARFDENRAADLRPGQPARVTPDADTSQELPAQVQRISPVADRSNTSAQVVAELAFDAAAADALAAGVVRPGYTTTVRVTVSRRDDVLLIPLEAITDGDDGSFVYRVVPQGDDVGSGRGSAERVDIEVLERNATLAAARSPELRVGNLIALIDIDALEPGAEVGFDPPGSDAR